MVGSLLGMGHVMSPQGPCQSAWGCGGIPVGMGTSEGPCGDGDVSESMKGHDRVPLGMWQHPCRDMTTCGVPVGTGMWQVP